MLSIGVLGAVEAVRDDERLALPAGKTTELLARLALDAGVAGAGRRPGRGPVGRARRAATPSSPRSPSCVAHSATGSSCGPPATPTSWPSSRPLSTPSGGRDRRRRRGGPGGGRPRGRRRPGARGRGAVPRRGAAALRGRGPRRTAPGSRRPAGRSTEHLDGGAGRPGCRRRAGRRAGARWSPSSRCANGSGSRSSPRSTAPGGRRTRWTPARACAGSWSTSSASTPARSCAPSSCRCCEQDPGAGRTGGAPARWRARATCLRLPRRWSAGTPTWRGRCDALTDGRLVTVVGPAGVGKTAAGRRAGPRLDPARGSLAGPPGLRRRRRRPRPGRRRDPARHRRTARRWSSAWPGPRPCSSWTTASTSSPRSPVSPERCWTPYPAVRILATSQVPLGVDDE